ncbi:MAG: hypothetical protein JXB30_02970 [Anaerolineae bacterium]|nr:hypothetical protein [Anaerolineae bacterium]
MNKEYGEKQTMPQSPDALKGELDVLRNVFDAMRTEIRGEEDKLTSNINYTLAAMGAVVVLINLISTTQQYIILLVLPYVFFTLAFKNLEHHQGIYRLSGYLLEKVYPRMREIIRELDGGSHDFGSFDQDFEPWHRQTGFRRFMLIPVAASNYGLHLLFSLLPVAAFFYYRQSVTQGLSAVEWILLASNVVGFVVLVTYLIGFWLTARRSREKQPPAKPRK